MVIIRMKMILFMSICLFFGGICVPYSTFLKTKTQCSVQFNIEGSVDGRCQYKIFENSITDTDCAEDLQKSRICAAHFGECYDISDNDQYPLVCYLCWVQSPAQTDIYRNFQQCINEKVWEPYLIVSMISAICMMLFI